MRRLLGLLAGAVLASVSLSGCWLQVGFDAGHTRHNAAETTLTPANVASLSQQWAVDLFDRAGEPLVRGSRVYVVTGGLDGNQAKTDARAYAIADGHSLWTRSFLGNGAATFWEPSFVKDELWTGYFMVDFSGPRPIGAYAAPVRIDPADGSVISSVQDAVGVSAPVESGDFVVQSWAVVNAPQRQLVVRDKATLATAWTATLLGDVGLGFPGPAPAVVDGQIFLGDGNTLYAFPLAGCGAATCAPTWTLDLGSHPTMVAAAPGQSSVFVLTGTDLVAVDRASGAIAWTSDLGGGAAGLAITDDWVYVAVGGALATFPPAGCGAATCQPSASGTLDANATSAPVVAGDVIYVGITGGVQAIDATVGPLMPLATLPITGSPSSVVVDGGRLFVVTVRPAPLPSKLVAFIPLDVPPPPDAG